MAIAKKLGNLTTAAELEGLLSGARPDAAADKDECYRWMERMLSKVR